MDNIRLLYIDLFCGAGGTSTGVEKANYKERKCAKVIACVNHDAKPYRSPQEVITEIPAGIVGVQRLALRRERRVINHYAEEQDKPIATATYYDYTAEVDGHPVPLEILAENDGLTVDDFKAWFAPIFAETDKKYPQFAGLASAVTIDFAIIHFTKRRY